MLIFLSIFFFFLQKTVVDCLIFERMGLWSESSNLAQMAVFLFELGQYSENHMGALHKHFPAIHTYVLYINAFGLNLNPKCTKALGIKYISLVLLEPFFFSYKSLKYFLFNNYFMLLPTFFDFLCDLSTFCI